MSDKKDDKYDTLGTVLLQHICKT